MHPAHAAWLHRSVRAVRSTPAGLLAAARAGNRIWHRVSRSPSGAAVATVAAIAQAWGAAERALAGDTWLSLSLVAGALFCLAVLWPDVEADEGEGA